MAKILGEPDSVHTLVLVVTPRKLLKSTTISDNPLLPDQAASEHPIRPTYSVAVIQAVTLHGEPTRIDTERVLQKIACIKHGDVAHSHGALTRKNIFGIYQTYTTYMAVLYAGYVPGIYQTFVQMT